MRKEEAIKILQSSEELFVIYSQATKMPYVTCDEETFNDQVRIYTDQEATKKYGEEKLKEKVLLMGSRVPKEGFPKLYGILHSIGVNEVVLVHEGEETKAELSSVAVMRDFSDLPQEQKPVFNPTLQLSALYFLQELRRPVDNKEKKELRNLEEELLVNISRGEYLVLVEANEGENKQIHLPYVKNEKGDAYQPLFTDLGEVQKFVKSEKPMRILGVSFEKLPGILIKDAKGIVINPMGFNLPLSKEQLEKIAGK
ncbi:MAG TPA: SseB family protein [Candidatus Blautia avistercoris]|nr:SseB family protein [Candidatus Blautia avistercoris]